ncbi:MAG: hypothetical protein J0I49_29265, partial [Pseudonocardia sp.]|nr:hypothetical protein [Pseudonocardia sp.]
MQLALTPEVLFPLGACAVVAVAVIAVVVVILRGRRTARDETSAPTAADWTGEAATADPTPTPSVTVPALPQRLTVAEAIAVREADTAPLPVSSVAFLGARPAAAAPVTTGPLPVVQPAPADEAGPAEPETSEPETPQAETARAETSRAETS